AGTRLQCGENFLEDILRLRLGLIQLRVWLAVRRTVDPAERRSQGTLVAHERVAIPYPLVAAEELADELLLGRVGVDEPPIEPSGLGVAALLHTALGQRGREFAPGRTVVFRE